MKRMGAALLAISLSAVTLPAQNAGVESSHSNQQPVTLTSAATLPLPFACPVLMHAGHLADGSMVRTGTAHPSGIGQWLSLSLTSLENRQIAKATLTVHGLTPKAHVTQTLSARGGPDDSSQTFHLAFSSSSHQPALATLWVPGVSAVERIDIESVDYADGSIWKLSDGQSCQVKPDPYMLITSR
jgi:hypothetical protein